VARLALAAEQDAGSLEFSPERLKIARLAVRGATNQQIGERLLISESTVRYHLRTLFRQLGIRRRVQLAHALEKLAADGPEDCETV
jgi:DNA-binding NarL/FixJ family response regulator